MYSLIPCSLHGGDDNIVILTNAKNEHCVVAIMPVVATKMGSAAALFFPPFHLLGTRDLEVTSLVEDRTISICRQTSNVNGVAEAILNLRNGVRLFVGKVVTGSRK